MSVYVCVWRKASLTLPIWGDVLSLLAAHIRKYKLTFFACVCVRLIFPRVLECATFRIYYNGERIPLFGIVRLRQKVALLSVGWRGGGEGCFGWDWHRVDLFDVLYDSILRKRVCVRRSGAATAERPAAAAPPTSKWEWMCAGQVI